MSIKLATLSFTCFHWASNVVIKSMPFTGNLRLTQGGLILLFDNMLGKWLTLALLLETNSAL